MCKEGFVDPLQIHTTKQYDYERSHAERKRNKGSPIVRRVLTFLTTGLATLDLALDYLMNKNGRRVGHRGPQVASVSSLESTE